MKQRRILSYSNVEETPPPLRTTLFAPSKMLPLMFIWSLLLFVTPINAIDTAQAFPSTIWPAGTKTINMGATTSATLGLELNFWMKPARTLDDPTTAVILNFLTSIGLQYQLYQTPANVLGHALQLKYAGQILNGTIPLNLTTYQWINVNIRVQFLSYITMSIWQGNQTLNLAPDVILTQLNPTAFFGTALQLMPMTSSLFVHMAEVRVFALDSATGTQSLGQYFKFYRGVTTNLIQAITASANLVYLDMNNAATTVNNTSGVSFIVERCNSGEYVTSKSPTSSQTQNNPTENPTLFPSQTLMTNYQCNYCPMANCAICPANYNSASCKSCSSTVSCSVDINCPTGYYAQNGICVLCTAGCTSCTSALFCTSCGPALFLDIKVSSSLCECASLQYAIVNVTANTVSCAPCDQTKCSNCKGSSQFCTSCQTNIYLYMNTCVLNCSAQITILGLQLISGTPSYTSIATKSCLPCGPNCNFCTNATFCNANSCAATSAITYYNHNGNCTSNCPDRTLVNMTAMTCENCVVNCLICSTTVNNCVMCNKGYFVYQAGCVAKCPNGMYPDTTFACKTCPQQCILCMSLTLCTLCKNTGILSESYYYVNYQCVKNCPAQYYPDKEDLTYLFCRSCPSGCNQCTDEMTCTVCNTGWYLDSFTKGSVSNNDTEVQKLCVATCQPGSFPNNGTMSCLSCLKDCEKCDNVTTCSQCSKGLVLAIGNTTTCSQLCIDGQFSDPRNTCKNCISGCQLCNNNYTCNQCLQGYNLINDTQACMLSSCPSGYYQLGASCYKCMTQCYTCSASITCDSCIVGYEFGNNKCKLLCGNGQREQNEQCDDNNNEPGDGCSSTCKVESNYMCMPLDPATTGPDVCFCDAQPRSAVWAEYWGQIEIKFGSNIVYNASNGIKSVDAKLFCAQILDPIMLTNNLLTGNLLGTAYSCFLSSSAKQSTILIKVGLDATIGNLIMNYTTIVKLNNHVLSVEGCPVSIPLTYRVTNLPLDSPVVYFQTAFNGLVVPKCSSYYGLNIFTSKGFTLRNVLVQWQIVAMQPDNAQMMNVLQQHLDSKYLNVKYFEFTSDQIESLQGTSVIIKANATNFLGISGQNTTTLIFSNMKTMYLIDLQDIYTFQTAVPNTLAPRIRIPYCLNDNSTTQTVDLNQVTLVCTLFSEKNLISTPLPNCTIKAFNMTIGKSYTVQVSAVNRNNPNMGVTKRVHIDTASPNSEIAFIDGCSRMFSVNKSFSLTAMISTNVSYAIFNWYCTDTATGSPCFTTSYSYITLANTQQVSVSGNQLFDNNTYLFTVKVFDELSGTQNQMECKMYAAPIQQQVLNIVINTEANKNGYIDFNAQMAAFKAQIIDNITISGVPSFKWQFTDSSGTQFLAKDMSLYQNSMGVLISKLERSNVYQVQSNATYGNLQGYIKTYYYTEPLMTFQFAVEPPIGEPLLTVFTFSVTSQNTYDGLYLYVFGYVNPVDGISYIPIYQKSTNRYQRTTLPVAPGQSYLSCYVQVFLPSGQSKTYLQNITMTNPTTTVAQFKAQLNTAVMDDLIESMQIKYTLVTLQSKMALADISFAIRQILTGLQNENTPLSDYNIQSSVSSILEYVSLQTLSLKSDARIITVAANLFQQITIGENVNINKGQASQFIRAATNSLYNFANNILQIDFTKLIGGQPQQQMKAMFMTGLKNILKGSLSNQILGDNGGGFSYQGQNIYVKAIKFDQREVNYMVNASLPLSLGGKLVQNFVNISLPKANSSTNPCAGFPACQISIIILDVPANAFMSVAKSAILMSMLVDISIMGTEISSPNSYVQISDIAVTNLVDPIILTIPLLIQFTDKSGNTTLGCGYMDPQDQVFKETGISTKIITTRLVTCQAYHLTPIGVEQYTLEQNISSVTSVVVVSSTNGTSTLIGSVSVIVTANMWGSWAVYMNFILLAVLIVGLIWGYQKDKRDELNLKKVFLGKEKIYVNLFFEPLTDDALARVENDENDYEAIQIEKQRLAEIKAKAYDERKEKKRRATHLIDVNAPVKGLFNQDEQKEIFGIKEEANQKGEKTIKKTGEVIGKKAAKKKKKKGGDDDMFFEGGQPEYILEGGDDEELKEDEAAEETVKTKAKKKKKKGSKKSKSKSKTAKETVVTEVEGDEASSPVKQIVDTTGMVVEDVDKISRLQSTVIPLKKSKKSRGKSAGKKKKTIAGPKVAESVAESRPVTPDIQFNNETDFDNFKPAAQAAAKKKAVRGARSSKIREQTIEDDAAKDEDLDNEMKPDMDAEVMSPSPKKQGYQQSPTINKVNLFKPIREIEKEKRDIEKERRDIEKERRDIDKERAEAQEKYNKDLKDDRFDVKSEVRSKKSNQKPQKKKKKGKKGKEGYEEGEEVEEEEYYPEEEPEPEKLERDPGDEDPASYCQFCCWNFRENHRCLSLFAYYNNEMSRSVRVALLVMSWYLLMAFSGFFTGANPVIGVKSTIPEQFMCGLLASIIVRPWILAVTYFMMHPQERKIYEIIANKLKASQVVRSNHVRFLVGCGIVTVSIIFCFAMAFDMSGTYTTIVVGYWSWSYLFAIISDFIIMDGFFMSVVTVIAIKVGVAPDTCGRKRSFWLGLIPPAIKDSVE